MKPEKVIIGHSWSDVSVNIQTKAVAYELSKEAGVWYFTQARIKEPPPQNKNLRVLEWPNKRPTSFKDFIFAYKHIKQIRPDIVIVHFASTKPLIFAGWLFRVKYRIAWYHTLYNQTLMEASWLKAKFDVFVRSVVYKMSTHVVTLNQFAARDVTSHQNVSIDKVRIIPNGVLDPVKSVEDPTYDSLKIKILYVGRLTKSKGCDLFLPVFKNLSQAYDVEFHLYGVGDDTENLKRLINEMNLQSAVTLHGQTKSYEEVYKHMSEAYFLVMPSRIDNYPTVIIEAMACGTPVIGADVGGIPEMIEEEVDGFVCKTQQQWIERCSMLIEDRSLRNQMAKNARYSFEKKHSIKIHVDRVMQFIHELP